MAKIFYYDSVGLLDLSSGSVTAGAYSSGNFSVSAGNVTNEHYINDQSLSNSVTSFDDEDTIRIDFGGAKAIDFALIYMTASDSQPLKIYQSTAATSGLTEIGSIGDSELNAGWNLEAFSSATKRYWFFRANDGTITDMSEIILGTKLTFEVEPDMGISTQESFATDLNVSYGGVEYANKRHNPKTTWTLNFSNISSTFKGNLVNFEQDVTNYKKFVYYDDSSYHYVRLDAPIKFTEVAYQRFSASLKLREQLS